MPKIRQLFAVLLNLAGDAKGCSHGDEFEIDHRAKRTGRTESHEIY